MKTINHNSEIRIDDWWHVVVTLDF